MLGWDRPWREPFRDMLAHPGIVPYLHAILGKGFRLDHLPSLIGMRRGAEGHMLHGSSGPGFDPHQYYIFQDGQMHNGLTVVSWQLTDVNPGDGGLCLIPGSHKCNFALPLGLKSYEQYQEFVKPITCKAGDVVIFTEAVTHGTMPWQSEHQRRSILIRYSPGNLAYAKHYVSWPEAYVDGLSEEQRAVMESPYHIRLERPVLDDTGGVGIASHKEAPTLTTPRADAQGEGIHRPLAKWRAIGNRTQRYRSNQAMLRYQRSSRFSSVHVQRPISSS